MKKNKTLLILGGGPAGVSTAYYASLNKIDFELYEATDELGGNCKTFSIDNFLFDSGAHRFHDKDSESTKLLKSIMGDELKKIHVPSQIFVDNKYFV